MQHHLPRHLTLLFIFLLQIMALIVSVVPGHAATAAQRTQTQSSQSLASSEDFLSDKKASSCAVMDSAYGITTDPAYSYWYPLAPTTWPVTYLKNHNFPGVLVGDFRNAHIRLRHTSGSGIHVWYLPPGTDPQTTDTAQLFMDIQKGDHRWHTITVPTSHLLPWARANQGSFSIEICKAAPPKPKCAVMDSAYGITTDPAYSYWYPLAPTTWPVTYLKNHNFPGVLVGDFRNAHIRLRRTSGSGIHVWYLPPGTDPQTTDTAQLFMDIQKGDHRWHTITVPTSHLLPWARANQGSFSIDICR